MNQNANAGCTSRLEAVWHKLFNTLGGGIVVVSVHADARGRYEESSGLPREFGAWLHIGETGTVTAGTGKVEMGQNIRTSLTQAVTEEALRSSEFDSSGDG